MSVFICLEGVDAVGKTEVSKCLARKLGYQYYKSPGSPFVEIRGIVDNEVDPLTRYFFYRAATQNDSRRISEMLRVSGVVCDRYIYSTFAFHSGSKSSYNLPCSKDRTSREPSPMSLLGLSSQQILPLRSMNLSKRPERRCIITPTHTLTTTVSTR